jgi:hypothetical protein
MLLRQLLLLLFVLTAEANQTFAFGNKVSLGRSVVVVVVVEMEVKTVYSLTKT